MSTDNRTIINDCEATTGWSGDDSASTDTDSGSFYEGSTALTWQAGSASERMSTTQDSVGAGTFNLDWSDSTLYMLTKDNLSEGFSAGGIQLVIGDGTDLIGYNVGGNDAAGISLPLFYSSYKLDVSVVVTTPGSFTAHSGSEANLNHAAITRIGLGLNHTANAMGPSDNTAMDCFRYIANDSYALTINGGTSGTPETMSDVAADDVTNGWGMVSNPFGPQFLFFAPTEWGESAATADHYFTASDEQWYWMGDNGGGHAVGAGHFIFRVIGNATDAGSFVISNVVIVNTGTGADFDCSNTDIDTLEISGGTIIGLSTFNGPSAGGTSRFCTTTSFLQCGQITHNGASMNGSSVLNSIVGTGVGSLFYNETADPDGEMDGMTFEKGAAAHAAIEFGTSAPLTMTLTNVTLTGFNASDGQNDSALLFPDTGSDVAWTVNVVGGTGTFSFRKLRAGDTVTIASSVSISLEGLTEASRGIMIGSGGAEDGNILLQGYADSAGVVSGTFSGVTPQTVIAEARNGGIIAACIRDDALTFTDFTDAARDRGTADDCDFLPAAPATGDNAYFAGVDPFGSLRINLTTAGSTYVGTWEYWNGAWVALSVTDNTNSFQTSGINTVTFTAPGDWATTSVDSLGPFYYIRFRVTSGGGAGPQAETVSLGDTVKYLPFNKEQATSGTIQSGTGLVVTATWTEDGNNP